MRQRALLLAGLFGVLFLVFLAAPPEQEQLPPLTVHSAHPSGGRALRLWLEELQYAPVLLERVPFRVAQPLATLLLLQPTEEVERDEEAELERWVRAGGTLIAAGEGVLGAAPLRRFGFEARALPLDVELASTIGSRLAAAQIGRVTVRASDELIKLPDGAEPFLGEQGRIFGAAVSIELGRVVALTTPVVFSNVGLRNPENARLVLALIGAGGSGTVAFDEVHHGYGQRTQRDFMDLLLDHSWGQAALYVGLLTLAFLLLRGRRLGRSRPLVISRGRSLSEYVGSLAALHHAGGKRSFAARHFERRLRREAAAQLGLPSDASDDQLAAGSGAVGKDAGPLLRGLRTLGATRAPGEAELIVLVGETERAIVALRQRPAPVGPIARSQDVKGGLTA